MKSPSEHLLGIIGDIYEAASQPPHWNQVLKGVAGVTESRSATLIYRDNELERADCLYVHNQSAEVLRAYNDYYGRLDPSFRLAAEIVPTGVAIADHQMTPSRDELIRICGEFYTGFMQPYDIHHFCGAHIFNNPRQSAAISVQRGEAAGEWTDQLIQYITDLVPHFQRALNIHREFTRLRARESALQAGLDRLLIGLIVFDEFMHPVYSNPVAHSILEWHPAISMQGDKIYASNLEDTRSIRVGLKKALQCRADDEWQCCSALGLKHPDATTPLPALITPMCESELGLRAAGFSTHAALFLSDPERNQPILPDTLCDAYHLTRAEAEVAISITNGLNIDEIANAKGVTGSTVQSQLKSVFRKLGVNRQVELVRLLLTSPFRMPV
jgi:DNA-binding CsgD family transcriptional regulator/PAS domain-containing protein